MLKVRSVLLGSVAALALVAFAAGPASAAGMTASGSIGQAYVLGASEGQSLTLINARGKTVGKGTADRLGSFIFRTWPPVAATRCAAPAQLARSRF